MPLLIQVLLPVGARPSRFSNKRKRNARDLIPEGLAH